jgi:hypothetical protein
MSHRSCTHGKGELQWRRVQETPKGLSGRKFSKFTSSEQSYAAALRQATTGTADTCEKCAASRAAATEQQEIQKTGL